MSTAPAHPSVLSPPPTADRARPAHADATPREAPDGMTGQNVICFAKDWDENPTSNNHIMRLLGRGNRVLWLNSIATRTPNLRNSRDLAKIVRKVVSFFRGPKHVDGGLWVYTPVVLPFPHSRLATRVNAWILRASLAFIRRRLGLAGAFQLWVFIPTAARYVGKLGESMVVYYVTDEYSKFSYVDGAEVAANDRDLSARADVVFATAQSLVDRRRPQNAETHLSRHGVDHALFARALDGSTAVPPDLAALRGPVLGFYGAIQDWLDFDLIEYLARRHPEWSIALIGPILTDVERLRGLPNVHFLGRKPHHELPAYCKGLSVGLVPHKVNELTLNMNPIKLREYLSAGLPVVSVALPEVEACGDQCAIARTYDEFERGVEEAIRTDSLDARRARSGAVRHQTWERRVAEIGDRVMRIQRAKSTAGPGVRR
jgi:glycosyltransferase involved in cell wall biosynthesis